ncbi:hypothetical protein GCM10025864_09790 [Luteimicrobium album]|uniref:Asp23/Gls24 family envelope stress response protein n=1 Tax=Luteimicrobium album TaxID=1054550 RepID=A0ABQ6I0C0_9MICO|nr:hypothetical protein [Luteimicrobium album]GMA23220.1 hypothetical protein GCM10025864_09790 [Luteimicrobium album]
MVDDTVVSGETTVADRALARIAEHGARSVLGHLAAASGRQAKVSLGRTGRVPRVDVRVRAVWPEPAAQVARRVADRVRSDLGTYASLDDCAVDVLVDGYDVAPVRGGRRVR